jgi:threonine dehydratase
MATQDVNALFKSINDQKQHIRKILGFSIGKQVRVVPELNFFIDDSYDYAEKIKGKTIVCIVSGSNNDIDRMQEIKERSLVYEGLKHYFLIRFAQRPGALKDFVNLVLGPTDDITRFEYMQKHNKEAGPALVGLELKLKKDYDILMENMKKYQINFTEINKEDDNMYGYLI